MRNLHPAIANLALDIDSLDAADTIPLMRASDVATIASAALAEYLAAQPFTDAELAWFRSPVGA